MLFQPTCGHCKIMLDLGSVSVGEAQRIYKMLSQAKQSAKRLQNFFHFDYFVVFNEQKVFSFSCVVVQFLLYRFKSKMLKANRQFQSVER